MRAHLHRRGKAAVIDIKDGVHAQRFGDDYACLASTCAL